MKRFTTILLVLLMVSVSAWSAGSSEKAKAEKPVELIFTSISVSGDSHTEAMYVFADKVKELTNGSVEVKVYDNGTLFSSENEFDALINGEADIAYLSFPTIATQIPSFSMFGSGYFFSSYEHMTATLNGSIADEYVWPKVRETLGVQPLGSLYLGSRVVNTRNTPINSYADMNGLLLRMPNSEPWLFLGKALGANPTPLSFSELYSALQTGAVDGQDNPLPTVDSAKFYEVTKYLALTNHVIDSVTPCINLDKWNSMTVEQQEAVQEAMTVAIEYNDKTRIAAEAKLVDFFKEKGLTVTTPDITEFRDNVQAAYAANTKMVSTWDMDLYEKVQNLAK